MRLLALRLLRLVTVLLAVSVVSFLLLNLLPGDPTLALLGPSAGDPHAKAEVQRQLGLDEPLPLRYTTWLGHAVRGDLGHSYFTNQSVVQAMSERLPLTIELMIFAELISLGVAVPVAITAARRPNGWFDRATSAVTFGLLALPAFMLGILLIYAFTVQWRLFPSSGQTPWFSVGDGVVATPRSIFLPALTLAAGQIAVFARVLRSDLVATLRSDYILAARAKGIPDRRVMTRHALRPSSFSLLTLAGLSVGALVGGAIIVEQIFALPGMGRLLVTAIFKRDYMIVQGGVLLVAVAFVLVNFIVEIVYAVLDPRIRRGNALA